MRMLAIVFLMFLSMVGLEAQEISVAAASDLQFALQDISTKFRNESGITVRVTYGSSGNFTTQIENGAPFDVFLSADTKYPERLIADGFAEGGSLYGYARGRLVLWVPKESKLNLQQGMSVLLRGDVHKIAIANPKHAPYGRAAEEALKSVGVYDRVAGKLVLGENISQTAQFVQSGNADIGLIAFSLAVSPPMASKGRYFEVPSTMYTPIQQAAVIVKESTHRADATKFLAFMRSEGARKILKEYGFSVPGD